jgi:hypothetical protein
VKKNTQCYNVSTINGILFKAKPKDVEDKSKKVDIWFMPITLSGDMSENLLGLQDPSGNYKRLKYNEIVFVNYLMKDIYHDGKINYDFQDIAKVELDKKNGRSSIMDALEDYELGIVLQSILEELLGEENMEMEKLNHGYN